MQNAVKENERLRRENEHLMRLVDNLVQGLDESVRMWRERYLQLLKQTWVIRDESVHRQ